MGINSFWRFGLNAGVGVDAARRVEIVDVDQQLRLTQANGNGFAEFFVRNNSRLLIMPNGANTGFTTAGDVNYNPTERIDVNGTARLRNVVTGTADALIIGTRNGGAANDLTLRRLNFTGNSNQVLLGNGTWGTLPPVTPVITANNGILNNGGVLQLGAPCNNGAALFASAITQDRSVFMTNGNSLWFSTLAASTGGIGLGAQPASTPFCGVGNTVEISANSASAYGIINSSGLRFTRLNSGSATIPNGTNGVNSTKVLTVDGNGDVVLTNPISSFGFECSDVTNSLFTSNKKVDLNDYNFYFERNVAGSINNNVGFGWPCGQILKAKVDAYQLGVSGIAGSFLTFRENGAIGARGMATGDGNGTGLYFGLIGSASGFNNGANYGVYSNAISAPNNYAGYFNGDVQAGALFISSDSILKQNVNPLTSSLKLISQLKPKTYYYKTDEYSQFNLANTKQYGFIAQELATILPELVKSSVQPGEMTPDGDLTGNSTNFLAVNYNAIIPINTSAIIELNQKVDKATLSDETIKTNVQDLSGSLDKVLDMRGVSYDWDVTVQPDLNLDSSNHVGFIAQEIEVIDPRLTFLGDDSLLHVEYDKVVPILAEAIQELNSTIVSKDSIINNLNDRLSALENCLAGVLPFLCQMNQQAIQANTPQAQEQLRKDIAVTLTNRSTIILDQNVPNPFAEQTVINISIPETVKKAQIHFYNQEGRIIQTVDVLERGLGSVTVFGADLSSGVYTYTLVADGQIVATKKMMKM